MGLWLCFSALWFSLSVQPFQNLLKLYLKSKAELRTLKELGEERSVFESDADVLSMFFCIAIILKLVLSPSSPSLERWEALSMGYKLLLAIVLLS